MIWKDAGGGDCAVDGGDGDVGDVDCAVDGEEVGKQALKHETAMQSSEYLTPIQQKA